MEQKEKATKINPKKVEAVAKLSDKLGKAKAFFLTDYRGLTHQQLESLKKALKKVEAEFVVTKNTLFKLALENLKPPQDIIDQLKNPTAVLFAFGDEIAAIKELANFIKNRELPKIKIGIFSQKIATETDFQKLATIPTREVLLATLVGRLQSPLFGLHYALSWNLKKIVYALNAVKSKKPQLDIKN